MVLNLYQGASKFLHFY